MWGALCQRRGDLDSLRRAIFALYTKVPSRFRLRIDRGVSPPVHAHRALEGPESQMSNPPTQIGPFEIERPLGSGGMAETFVAVRRGPEGFEQRVCVKRILPGSAHDAEFTRQFTSEARIAAALRHGNIVQVLDFGEENGAYFQALELIEGLDLRLLLERVGGGISPDIVAYLGIELATALDYAHRAVLGDQGGGIVHRDVSPSNVLLSVEGEVKLADFGIARLVSGPKHTATGVIRGKVPYMAPEYARTGRFEKQADLFSLGVVLFECLTGHRPYDGLTDLETLHRAMQGERESLSDLAPDAHPALRRVVEQLIDSDPQKRPESASAVVDALIATVPLGDARRRLRSLVRLSAQSAERAPGATASDRGVRRGANDLPGDGGGAHLSVSPYSETRTAQAGRGRGPVRADPALWALPKQVPKALVAVTGLAALALLVFVLVAVYQMRAPTRLPPLVAGRSASPNASLPPFAAPEKTLENPPEALVARESASAESQAAVALPPASDVRASAVLTVVVLPFGEVQVDGRFLGTAPVTLTLRPGPHEVRVTGASGVTSRTVQLTAGEKRRLVVQ